MKVKSLLLIIGSLIVIATIPVLIYFLGKNQDQRSRAAPATTFTFSPATLTKTTQDTAFDVKVMVDTGDDPRTNNQLTAASLVITYNKDVLQATAINLGTFFPDPSQVSTIAKTIDQDNGKITYKFFTLTQNAGSGQGVLATITFKPKAAGASPLAFVRPDTKAIAYDEDTDVIVGSGLSGANITITGDATTTVAPTPTSTVSATLTPSPTTKAGATVTPTIKTTLTPTPTGTESATLTITPTPIVEASGSGTLSITTPTTSGVVTESAPTIKGTAAPGSTITVVIYSDPITGTTTADANGNWSFTAPTALADGSHTVTVTEQTTSGATNTTNKSFTVQTAAVPATGSFETTLLVLAGGLLFILLGAGVAVVNR